jgi:hypothetical protein
MLAYLTETISKMKEKEPKLFQQIFPFNLATTWNESTIRQSSASPSIGTMVATFTEALIYPRSGQVGSDVR